MDGWVNGWPDVKSLKSNKSWPNRDNSIMDILDIFWTFYLNHLSPLWGYFFSYDLDLDPMTLILKLDLDMVKMYLHTKNEVPMSSGSKVIAWTDRNTDNRHTDTHRQTDTQTDRHDQKHYLPAYAGGNDLKQTTPIEKGGNYWIAH